MAKIIIDTNKCIGKGICVEICPLGVYEVRNTRGKEVAVAVKPNECILCGACELKCPAGAIRIASS